MRLECKYLISTKLNSSQYLENDVMSCELLVYEHSNVMVLFPTLHKCSDSSLQKGDQACFCTSQPQHKCLQYCYSLSLMRLSFSSLVALHSFLPQASPSRLTQQAHASQDCLCSKSYYIIKKHFWVFRQIHYITIF